MNLRDYMHFRNLKQHELSEMLMIAPNYLGAIARGERKPSIRLAHMIEIKLNGEVTAKEIFDYFKEQQILDKEALT